MQLHAIDKQRHGRTDANARSRGQRRSAPRARERRECVRKTGSQEEAEQVIAHRPRQRPQRQRREPVHEAAVAERGRAVVPHRPVVVAHQLRGVRTRMRSPRAVQRRESVCGSSSRAHAADTVRRHDRCWPIQRLVVPHAMECVEPARERSIHDHRHMALHDDCSTRRKRARSPTTRDARERVQHRSIADQHNAVVVLGCWIEQLRSCACRDRVESTARGAKSDPLRSVANEQQIVGQEHRCRRPNRRPLPCARGGRPHREPAISHRIDQLAEAVALRGHSRWKVDAGERRAALRKRAHVQQQRC